MHSLSITTLIMAAAAAALGEPGNEYTFSHGLDAATVFASWQSSSPHAANTEVLGSVPTDCTTAGAGGYSWYYRTRDTTTLAILCRAADKKCCTDTVGTIRFTGEPTQHNSKLDAAVWTKC